MLAENKELRNELIIKLLFETEKPKKAKKNTKKKS